MLGEKQRRTWDYNEEIHGNADDFNKVPQQITLEVKGMSGRLPVVFLVDVDDTTWWIIPSPTDSIPVLSRC
jgi:hypothetical protein